MSRFSRALRLVVATSFFLLLGAVSCRALDLVPGEQGNVKGVFVLSDGELYLNFGDDPSAAHLVSFTPDSSAAFLEEARRMAVLSKPWPADYSDAPLAGFRATVLRLGPGRLGLRMESRPVILDIDLGSAVRVARSICIVNAMGDDEAQEAMQVLREKGVLDRALREVLRRFAHGFQE